MRSVCAALCCRGSDGRAAAPRRMRLGAVLCDTAKVGCDSPLSLPAAQLWPFARALRVRRPRPPRKREGGAAAPRRMRLAAVLVEVAARHGQGGSCTPPVPLPCVLFALARGSTVLNVCTRALSAAADRRAAAPQCVRCAPGAASCPPYP
eukprot:TRINITY_DN5588_c1_g2_i1.p1 TRINITY_DN5588_c1_g2~~TRINITY_DN5588_c1_g2_i1.p1  ORF type:complete len:150 (-),score=12.90 TRINITY_DN5588_c1_g2_i1:337-786(-)